MSAENRKRWLLALGVLFTFIVVGVLSLEHRNSPYPRTDLGFEFRSPQVPLAEPAATESMRTPEPPSKGLASKFKKMEASDVQGPQVLAQPLEAGLDEVLAARGSIFLDGIRQCPVSIHVTGIFQGNKELAGTVNQLDSSYVIRGTGQPLKAVWVVSDQSTPLMLPVNPASDRTVYLDLDCRTGLRFEVQLFCSRSDAGVLSDIPVEVECYVLDPKVDERATGRSFAASKVSDSNGLAAFNGLGPDGIATVKIAKSERVLTAIRKEFSIRSVQAFSRGRVTIDLDAATCRISGPMPSSAWNGDRASLGVRYEDAGGAAVGIQNAAKGDPDWWFIGDPGHSYRVWLVQGKGRVSDIVEVVAKGESVSGILLSPLIPVGLEVRWHGAPQDTKLTLRVSQGGLAIGGAREILDAAGTGTASLDYLPGNTLEVKEFRGSCTAYREYLIEGGSRPTIELDLTPQPVSLSINGLKMDGAVQLQALTDQANSPVSGASATLSGNGGLSFPAFLEGLYFYRFTCKERPGLIAGVIKLGPGAPDSGNWTGERIALNAMFPALALGPESCLRVKSWGTRELTRIAKSLRTCSIRDLNAESGEIQVWLDKDAFVYECD